MAPQAQGVALYFDGVTGTAHAVTVTLEESALLVTPSDATAPARWPYSTIERLPAPPGRLRFGLAYSESVARLEVRDPAFAGVVMQHLGLGGPQGLAQERRHRRLVILWTAGAIAAVLSIGITGLPTVAGLLAPLVPQAMEAKIGAAAHQQTLAQYKGGAPVLCGDEGERERAGRAAFQKLFDQLEPAARLPIPVRPFVVRTTTINASAFPGGIMHVNQGIILLANSPDELAGVIGHELGHMVHRHSLRGYLHNLGLTYLITLAAGEVFTGSSVFIAVGDVLANRNTRAQERQADDYGVDLTARIGIDSHAAANLWERYVRRMREKPTEEEKAGPRALLSNTHPAPLERAAAIRATPPVANLRPLLTEAEWQALRLVCSRN
jgi:Zn-dependent protease with chaperone function